MPGLNSIISFININKNDLDRITGILERSNFDKSYFHETTYCDSNTGIFFSGYEQYPIQKFELGGKTLIIEGAIYNKTPEKVNEELGRILPQIASGSGKTDPLREFMFNTDGEYIVYYIDRELSTVVICNDAMGRLPAYFHANENGIILARLAKFLDVTLPVATP